MGELKTYELDGQDFTTLEGFYDVVSRVLIPGVSWGRNLDAFNDVLRGGFGTPAGGFVLRWKDAATSRQRLGYAETVRQLRRTLVGCHPSNKKEILAEIKAAERGEGPTVFDWLVEIIRDHGEGGTQAQDGVVLVLR